MLLGIVLCFTLGLVGAEALEVHIAWQAADPAPDTAPAQAYIVYRRDQPQGPWKEKARTTTETLEAVDKTVKVNQTYTYMVRAWANGVESENSEEVTTSTTQHVVGAPKHVVVSVTVTSQDGAGQAPAVPVPGKGAGGKGK